MTLLPPRSPNNRAPSPISGSKSEWDLFELDRFECFVMNFIVWTGYHPFSGSLIESAFDWYYIIGQNLVVQTKIAKLNAVADGETRKVNTHVSRPANTD